MTTNNRNLAQEEANKELVMKAYQEVFGNLDITAIDTYWSDAFIQHNPTLEDRKDGLKKLLQMLIGYGVPKTTIDYRHVAADGDFVWLHVRSAMTGKETKYMDIYRIENGKIAEHWDAIQEVPERSMNQNTMF